MSDELVEWLSVQFDLDEVAARGYPEQAGTGYNGTGWVPLPDRARLLREVETKRRIVAECLEAASVAGATWLLAVRTIRLLAAVYEDRPGYREEWRPQPLVA